MRPTCCGWQGRSGSDDENTAGYRENCLRARIRCRVREMVVCLALSEEIMSDFFARDAHNGLPGEASDRFVFEQPLQGRNRLPCQRPKLA